MTRHRFANAAVRAVAGAVAFAASASTTHAADAAPVFLAGVDFSHGAYFEAHGKVYREGGVPTDPFILLKRSGVNCVRLRLFTSTEEEARTDPYNRANNLSYNLPLATRVKKAGLKLLLDFHYSDSWADPQQQAKPKAWEGLTFDQLEQRLYEYNRDMITAFRSVGALPDYVQVGNEITPGMLWPDGRVKGASTTSEQWVKLARLLKSAERGIREAAGTQMPKVMIHIDRGGDWATTKMFFDHLREQNVPFDMIGESYYPFWHGNLGALRTCLNNAAERYGVPVVIAETDFPSIEKDASGKPLDPIVGIAPGRDGQVQFSRALKAILDGVPGGRG